MTIAAILRSSMSELAVKATSFLFLYKILLACTCLDKKISLGYMGREFLQGLFAWDFDGVNYKTIFEGHALFLTTIKSKHSFIKFKHIKNL